MKLYRRDKCRITFFLNFEISLFCPGVRLASGHGHAKSAVERAREHRVTLNDLPVPSGSWLEHHNKRNSKWNLLLAISAGTFAVTMYAVCMDVICQRLLSDLNLN